MARGIKTLVQRDVLNDPIEKNQLPEAERLVARTTPTVRSEIIAFLVRHYAVKDFPRAQAWLGQLADSDQYPFSAAADLLLSLGSEHALERLTIFNQALQNLRVTWQGPSRRRT